MTAFLASAWMACSGSPEQATSVPVDGGAVVDASTDASSECLSASGDYRGKAARMAYLKAVSVFAFERLEREPAAHSATPNLLRDTRRARRDEIRHTVMASRLAKRNGVSKIDLPSPPGTSHSLSLFEIALENAVEGCVRETYGAVCGLVDAKTMGDRSIQLAMRAIATDECRHADLAWSVHAWISPQLSAEERKLVEIAMKVAIDEVAARDARTASVLFAGLLAA